MHSRNSVIAERPVSPKRLSGFTTLCWRYKGDAFWLALGGRRAQCVKPTWQHGQRFARTRRTARESESLFFYP